MGVLDPNISGGGAWVFETPEYQVEGCGCLRRQYLGGGASVAEIPIHLVEGRGWQRPQNIWWRGVGG